MKKYIPSLDELIPGVLIILVGFIVWNFVGAPILKVLDDAIGKAKAKS